MILLKDGVKYGLYSYASEEELANMVMEHYKEIFSKNSLYFDPQTIKTHIGIKARNDGIILALDQNKWYIVEVELSKHKHSLHKHIIPQITKFNKSRRPTQNINRPNRNPAHNSHNNRPKNTRT